MGNLTCLRLMLEAWHKAILCTFVTQSHLLHDKYSISQGSQPASACPDWKLRGVFSAPLVKIWRELILSVLTMHSLQQSGTSTMSCHLNRDTHWPSPFYSYHAQSLPLQCIAWWQSKAKICNIVGLRFLCYKVSDQSNLIENSENLKQCIQIAHKKHQMKSRW